MTTLTLSPFFESFTDTNTVFMIVLVPVLKDCEVVEDRYP